MPNCPISGTELYYEDTGNGPAALFIHGMCGSANVWDGQVERLADEFRCVTYDRRGHSRSPLGNVTERSVELHADDAAQLIEALHLAPCVLVASSGGARIGVDLLRRYPPLFSWAALSEPPIFGLDPEQGGRQVMLDLQPGIEAAMKRGDPRGAVDAFFEYMCPGLWRQLDDSGRELYRANHVELMGDLQMRSYEITPADLASIDTPCTIISGAESHPVLRRVAAVIADAMPNGKLVEIPGVGHVTYAEAPAPFADIVKRGAAG